MDPTSTTETDPAPEPPTLGSGAVTAAERRGWAVQALLVATATLLVVGAGVGLWPRGDDAFCDRVAELPSIARLGDDGTPAAALLASADAYQRMGGAAGDESVDAAARTLAEHQRGLAAAVAGASSSSEVVEQVQALDEVDLDRASSTVDDAIVRRCG